MTGIDPVKRLIEEAQRRHPGGIYVQQRAEELSFPDGNFDLIISDISLIDIEDYRSAIREMTRVTRPGGRLLIANLNPFITCGSGWYRNETGIAQHYPVVDYSTERSLVWDAKWQKLRCSAISPFAIAHDDRLS